jgi:tight adherence protein B
LQILQVVVNEMRNPLAQEFQLILSEHHLGVSLDEALNNLTARVPTEDLSMAVNAILILRETGGDLSETFSVIAHTIRERRKVEGKIRAMREQALFQSIILFILPFAFALLMLWLVPGYLKPLFSNKWGYGLIAIMLGLQLAGGLWLKKIVTIDV